jgi:hypothetical protein
MGSVWFALSPCDADLFRHAHEIGDVAQPGLFHHSAAVDLDGLFDSSKIASNLLVKPLSDDVRKQLILERAHDVSEKVGQLSLGPFV